MQDLNLSEYDYQAVVLAQETISMLHTIAPWLNFNAPETISERAEEYWTKHCLKYRYPMYQLQEPITAAHKEIKKLFQAKTYVMRGTQEAKDVRDFLWDLWISLRCYQEFMTSSEAPRQTVIINNQIAA